MYDFHSRWIEEFDSPGFATKLEETEHQRAILALKSQGYQAELRTIQVCLVGATYGHPDISRNLLLPPISHVQSVSPTTTLADFLAQKERLRKKEQEVKIKRAKTQAFQGLPPVCFFPIIPRVIISTRSSLPCQNLALAKQELHQAREGLIHLSNLRERLLNNMVDEVS